jgi:exodeoxyribonuclease VII large subunit
MAQLPFTFQGRTRPAGPEAPKDAPREPQEPRPQPPAEPPVLGVGQLVRQLRGALEGRFPDLWVGGEISDFKPHRSGHVYFTLKDRQASLPVVMFEDHAQRLRFRPRDGMEVVARGMVTVWPKGGRMQLQATLLEPRGLGALQQEFEDRVRLLRGEGLTDPARKRPVPRYPAVIGVVTSPGGAALRDVVRTVLRRDPKAILRLAFTPVQGRSAAFHIVKALERLDAHGGCDVILVVRGGGSAEDLWAFNEEPVARAIAAARAPVITGIGHETDTTIADLVADLRASTPTAAAEHAVPPRAEVERAFAHQQARLHRGLTHHLHVFTRRLTAVERRLPRPEALLTPHAQALDELDARAERAARLQLTRAQARLRAAEARLERARPAARLARTAELLGGLEGRLHRAGAGLERRRLRLEALERRLHLALGPAELTRHHAHLDALAARLGAAARRQLRRAQGDLAQTVRRLESLSPLAVLGRGYALARSEDGRVLRRGADVTPGARVEVRLGEGGFRATVDGVDDG